MKRFKISLAAIALVLGVAASSFTTFNTPPNGAGWYAAANGVIPAGQSSYTYSNTSQYPSFIGSTAPVAGNGQGQCSTDVSFICAVDFNATGTSVATRTGDFNF